MVVLGKSYKDKITSFEGIATARTEFLFGCVRVCLESKKLKKDGEPQEIWFDEQRLTAKSRAKTGGSRISPPKRNTG